jgi:hypothetical protein
METPKATPQPTGLAGIQLLAGPQAQANAGIFNLPPEFDRKKYAANWVEEGGAVEGAKQRESILGTNFTADGWTVYKGKDGKPVKVHTGAGKKSAVYVLMFRPKTVQQNVNALYGNVGKHYARAEQTSGAISLAENGQDPGMLPTQVLDQLGVRETEFAPDEADNHFAENPVAGVSSGNITAPPLRT